MEWCSPSPMWPKASPGFQAAAGALRWKVCACRASGCSSRARRRCASWDTRRVLPCRHSRMPSAGFATTACCAEQSSRAAFALPSRTAFVRKTRRSRADMILAMNTLVSDSDTLILVDEADRSLGFLSKALCHEGRGVLHRAFSLLIFNDRGELLIQQRAASKRLWPMYWSNSCCSHPRGDESLEAATQRRLYEELGIRCPLQFLFKFQYQAQFDATGAA